MPTQYAQSGLRGAMFALVAFALYSTHDVIMKYLGSSFSVFQVVFFLNLFSVPLLLLMMIADKSRGDLRPAHPWWMAMRSIASAVAGWAVFYAFTVLKFAETYTILFTVPMFITALSVPLLGEQVGARRWAAVVAGFVGVLVVLQPGLTPIGLGHVAAMVGAVGVALTFLTLRKIGQAERTVVMVLYPVITNLAVMTCVLPFVYMPMDLPDLGLNALMAGLAFLAMLAMIGAYRAANAAVIAPMQYSQMLWAVLYGAWLFNESVGPNVLLGAGIIIASGIYITWRESHVRAARVRA